MPRMELTWCVKHDEDRGFFRHEVVEAVCREMVHILLAFDVRPLVLGWGRGGGLGRAGVQGVPHELEEVRLLVAQNDEKCMKQISSQQTPIINNNKLDLCIALHQQSCAWRFTFTTLLRPSFTALIRPTIMSFKLLVISQPYYRQ